MLETDHAGGVSSRATDATNKSDTITKSHFTAKTYSSCETGTSGNSKFTHLSKYLKRTECSTSSDPDLGCWERVMIWLWDILEDPSSSTAAFLWSRVMSFSILMSTAINFMQTIRPVPFEGSEIEALEVVIDSVFLIEIVLRFISSQNQTKFFYNVHNLIDLLGLSSLIARIVINFSWEASQARSEARYFILCVVPIFRGLKMLRRWDMLHLLFTCGVTLVIEVMPSLLFLMLVMAQLFSTAIYFCEPRSNIGSLPEAIWFTIITMSTVGYGGVIPVTISGKIITILLVICSALYMAVPIGIVGSAFNQVWENRFRLIVTKHVQARLESIGLTARDIPHVFERGGNSGALSLVDFQRIVGHMRLGVDEERVLELFLWMDTKNNGVIEAQEFVRAFYPRSYASMYGKDPSADSTRFTRAGRQTFRQSFKSIWAASPSGSASNPLNSSFWSRSMRSGDR